MTLLVGCAMFPLALVLFAAAIAVGLQWWPSLVLTPLALHLWVRWLVPRTGGGR